MQIQRLDHLGIVGGTIKDLGIKELIDQELKIDSKETITTGETVTGMLLNGLGFISRPLMLTPQFFENKPLEVLFEKDISSQYFNRHKLGRVLDAISEYGCEKLFSKLAMQACYKEKIDLSFYHADTTSYSLVGEYKLDDDDNENIQAVKIVHGHSKDKRPDLKQVVQELITTQDGGIPIMTKVFDGNASDSTILRARAEATMQEFSKSTVRCLVADSKLYAQKTAEILNKINFITRVPSSIKQERKAIENAIQHGKWETGENGYKFQEISTDYFEIKEQRWIIIFSKQAQDRTRKTLDKQLAKESKALEKELFHLQAQRFACEKDANKNLSIIAKKFDLHNLSDVKFNPVKEYAKKGRPSLETPFAISYQASFNATVNQDIFNQKLEQGSCFVLSTNLKKEKMSAKAILAAYKEQDKTEKGFAFLKGDTFFTASFYLKKPSRIEALIMIMTLALLVYSIAQRRLRKALEEHNETVPNQLNKPTSRPTMRWIFQLFEGINYVKYWIDDQEKRLIEGLNELRLKIIKLLSPNVQSIYQKFAIGV